MLKIKNFIIKYKFQIILLVIFIASAISIYIQDKDRKEAIVINSATIQSKEGKIGVYISGEVKKGGVYYLDKESRVTNLIDIAGGLTENADISKINPAQKLNDSDKIIIPEKKEKIEEELQETEENITNEEENYTSISGKININTATKEELKTLNGIGEATANKIINYRKSNHFTEIEDIMNVPGIGEAKFNDIKDYICI
jgi:competence protein ComEA